MFEFLLFLENFLEGLYFTLALPPLPLPCLSMSTKPQNESTELWISPNTLISNYNRLGFQSYTCSFVQKLFGHLFRTYFTAFLKKRSLQNGTFYFCSPHSFVAIISNYVFMDILLQQLKQLFLKFNQPSEYFFIEQARCKLGVAFINKLFKNLSNEYNTINIIIDFYLNNVTSNAYKMIQLGYRFHMNFR